MSGSCDDNDQVPGFGEQDELQRYVRRRVGKNVTVTRYHTDRDCTDVRVNEIAEDLADLVEQYEVIEVTPRECELLGLLECKKCETARTGGPAVATIARYLGMVMHLGSDGASSDEEELTDLARNLVLTLDRAGFRVGRRA